MEVEIESVNWFYTDDTCHLKLTFLVDHKPYDHFFYSGQLPFPVKFKDQMTFEEDSKKEAIRLLKDHLQKAAFGN